MYLRILGVLQYRTQTQGFLNKLKQKDTPSNQPQEICNLPTIFRSALVFVNCYFFGPSHEWSRLLCRILSLIIFIGVLTGSWLDRHTRTWNLSSSHVTSLGWSWTCVTFAFCRAVFAFARHWLVQFTSPPACSLHLSFYSVFRSWCLTWQSSVRLFKERLIDKRILVQHLYYVNRKTHIFLKCFY